MQDTVTVAVLERVADLYENHENDLLRDENPFDFVPADEALEVPSACQVHDGAEHIVLDERPLIVHNVWMTQLGEHARLVESALAKLLVDVGEVHLFDGDNFASAEAFGLVHAPRGSGGNRRDNRVATAFR
eukprot:Amastigsp_a132_250.p2 type:complete len:131 gc:universal Amastigsp_a132_250:1863-2255(+)